MPSSPETSGPSSDESLDAYVEQAVERVLNVDDQAEADDVVLMDWFSQGPSSWIIVKL